MDNIRKLALSINEEDILLAWELSKNSGTFKKYFREHNLVGSIYYPLREGGDKSYGTEIYINSQGDKYIRIYGEYLEVNSLR